MRSLPPPRITKRRKWLRIKRAIRTFFTKGYVSDTGAFMPLTRRHRRSVSIVQQSRFSLRARRVRIIPAEHTIGERANIGIAAVNYVGKLAAKAVLPLFKPFGKNTNKMNVTLKFWHLCAAIKRRRCHRRKRWGNWSRATELIAYHWKIFLMV